MDKEDVIRMLSNSHIEVKGDFVINKEVQYEVNQVDPGGIGIVIGDAATVRHILDEKAVSAKTTGACETGRVADKRQAADSPTNVAEKPADGATTPKRALFIRKDGSSAENEKVRRQEKERFMQYLQDHQMENHVLTCSVDNPLNEVVTGFVLTWINRKQTHPYPAGTAIFRFLTSDCGLQSEVTDRSYGNKIMERIKIEHCSRETQQEINRYFDE